jgi:hypothetical protein
MDQVQSHLNKKKPIEKIPDLIDIAFTCVSEASSARLFPRATRPELQDPGSLWERQDHLEYWAPAC